MVTLNTGAVQQGLSNLGQALARNNAILAEQQTASARLAVRSKLNDKINEMSQRQDFSGDWGQELRDFTHQAINEVGGDIKDTRVLAGFQNEMLMDTEGKVNTFREIQQKKQTEQIVTNLETRNEQGVSLAATDPQTFLVGVHGNLYNPKTGQFSQAALQAYGGPDGARSRTQQVVDAGAGAYVGAQLDRILNDQTKTWAEKKDQLDKSGGHLLAAFEIYGLPPSQATKAKLDDAVQKAQAQAQTAALKEHKDQGMAQLANYVSAVTPAWTQAKLGGRAFDPTAYLKPMMEDKGLDPDVRETLNTTLRTLALEADKNLSTEATTKALAQNLDRTKNQIQVLLKQGANSEFIDAKVIEWLKTGPDAGGLDARNYSEAVAFAKSGVGLEDDPIIKGVMTSAFKDLPPDAQTKMQVMFKELAGGLYNRGEPDAFKTNGRWDQAKLKAAAADMAQAEKDDALKQIISMNFATPTTVEYNELNAYVARASEGKLIGQFNASNIATRAQPFTDALYANLGTFRPDLVKQGKPKVEFNMYTSAGLPTYVFPDGTRAVPASKGYKIEWTITGGSAPKPGASAPDPNKRPQ